MWAAIGGLLNLVGSGVKGFFGNKGRQADVIESAIKVIGDVNSSEAQREAAQATIISSESTSGNWLAASWRPILMLVFAGLIVSRWFGHVPPNMTEAELLEVYGLLKLGIGGYVGGRTLEKIVQSININKLAGKFLGR